MALNNEPAAYTIAWSMPNWTPHAQILGVFVISQSYRNFIIIVVVVIIVIVITINIIAILSCNSESFGWTHKLYLPLRSYPQFRETVPFWVCSSQWWWWWWLSLLLTTIFVLRLSPCGVVMNELPFPIPRVCMPLSNTKSKIVSHTVSIVYPKNLNNIVNLRKTSHVRLNGGLWIRIFLSISLRGTPSMTSLWSCKGEMSEGN